MNGHLSHAKSQLVTRAELMTIPPPPSTATWRPVAHYDLIQAIDRQLAVREIQVVREEFALQRDGRRLFGILELRVPDLATDEGFGFAMGIRASNDKSEAITIVAGARVFVCDNLMLSGDLIALHRKHTAKFSLSGDVSMAVDRYREHLVTFNGQVEELKAFPLTDLGAKLMIYEAFANEILPLRFFPTVARTYFAGSCFPDVAPRTKWGLHNAFTRTIRVMAPAPAFSTTTKLGRLFGLSEAGS